MAIVKKPTRAPLFALVLVAASISLNPAQAQGSAAILKCDYEDVGDGVSTSYYRIRAGSWENWIDLTQSWHAVNCASPSRTCTINDAYYFTSSESNVTGSSTQINRATGDVVFQRWVAGLPNTIRHGRCERSTDPALIPRRPVL